MSDSDNVAVYLNDHLGGSAAALQLVDSLRADADPELGEVLEAVQDEILEDRETLLQVMRSMNVEPGAVKQVAGRIAGAALRLQASEAVAGSAELSQLLRLEVLVLGISGKIAGWTAVGASRDGRLEGWGPRQPCRARPQPVDPPRTVPTASRGRGARTA